MEKIALQVSNEFHETETETNKCDMTVKSKDMSILSSPNYREIWRVLQK